MFSQEQLPWPACERKIAVAEPIMPHDTADLEMWPQTVEAGETRFREAVREAAVTAGGQLLFDLPADGLVADRLRIAVAWIPDDDDKMRIVLATLDLDGAEIHLQMPDAATAHLVGFAEAFVGLFHSIAAPEAVPGEALDATAETEDAAEPEDIIEQEEAMAEPKYAMTDRLQEAA
jgi:hypothetical protein